MYMLSMIEQYKDSDLNEVIEQVGFLLIEVVRLECDADAGAVDGRVQPPELVLGPLQRRLHVLRLCHVHRHEDAVVCRKHICIWLGLLIIPPMARLKGGPQVT